MVDSDKLFGTTRGGSLKSFINIVMQEHLFYIGESGRRRRGSYINLCYNSILKNKNFESCRRREPGEMDSRIVKHPSQNRLGENCFPVVFLHFEKKWFGSAILVLSFFFILTCIFITL